MQRHYGMDWLRIGAFALLILYHTGMVFVPWGFHIKTAAPLTWAEIPMFLTSPWRLTLLFLVSGYASRALLARSPGLGAFLRNRSARLLIPLAFGMAVIVPPQTWVEVTAQHGYAQNYLHFWMADYFRFGTLFGIMMPTWNHLWFVLYLWVYTLLLAGLAAVIPASAQTLFDRVFANGRAVWLPILWGVAIQSLLFHRLEDSHDLVNDLPAHLRYVPAFLFGVGLAGSQPVADTLAKYWTASAALAVASYATIAGLLIAYPDFSFPNDSVTSTYRLARDIETWAAIAALVGAATAHWNRDHRWRATLTEAVFPFYIIHQTLIVVIEYWIKPLGLGAGGEFAVLVIGTAAGCWAFYLIGREIPLVRPLVGLRSRKTAARALAHDLDADDSRRCGADRSRPHLA